MDSVLTAQIIDEIKSTNNDKLLELFIKLLYNVDINKELLIRFKDDNFQLINYLENLRYDDETLRSLVLWKKLDDLLYESFQDFELDFAEGKEFVYDYPTSTVYYTFNTSKVDKWFMDFAKANGLKVKCSCFILSLLHEIGHNETIDMTDDEIDKSEYDVNSKDDVFEYFMLEDELEATLWAIDFINDNKEFIKNLDKQIINIIGEWFMINRIQHYQDKNGDNIYTYEFDSKSFNEDDFVEFCEMIDLFYDYENGILIVKPSPLSSKYIMLKNKGIVYYNMDKDELKTIKK